MNSDHDQSINFYFYNISCFILLFWNPSTVVDYTNGKSNWYYFVVLTRAILPLFEFRFKCSQCIYKDFSLWRFSGSRFTAVGKRKLSRIICLRRLNRIVFIYDINNYNVTSRVKLRDTIAIYFLNEFVLQTLYNQLLMNDFYDLNT